MAVIPITPDGSVFRRLHCALTMVLMVTVITGGFLFYSGNAKPDESVIVQRQLTSEIWLYISKTEGGGATVAGTYRYFLNKPSGNPQKLIRDSEPFMISDTGDAKINTVGDRVLVRITGTLFSFTNFAFFYDGDTPVGVMIDLNATANRRYGS